MVHQAGSTLTIVSGQTVAGIANISDHVDCQGTLRATSGGFITLNGGLTLSNNGAVDLGSGALNVADASTVISGGSLAAASIGLGCFVGSSISAGSVTQSGGVVTTSSLGVAPGTYSLTGGLIIASSEQLGGAYYTGTFTQAGGTNSISTGLVVGSDVGPPFDVSDMRANPADFPIIPYGGNAYNLYGGVLVLHALRRGSYSGGSLNFGGGTLQADSSFSTGLPMTLTVAGGNANVDSNDFAVTLSGVLSGAGGLNKLGAGTLTLTGNNTYAGLTTVSAGTLELGTSAQNPVLAGGGADVKSGKIIFDYVPGADPAATIEGLLTASYHGGLWNIGQFQSSTADASHGLGWTDDGLGKVTVAYALYGDCNLDGTVNGADLDAVLSHYNTTSGATWATGDFNYDGTVNGRDLNAILSNYGQNLDVTVGVAVPEPGTLALLLTGLAAFACLTHRGSPVGTRKKPISQRA